MVVKGNPGESARHEPSDAAASDPGPGRQTLVTCLFDLERRQGHGMRPIEFYMRHGDFVLGLDQPLVIYADPALAGWLDSQRRSRGFGELTRVVARPFEDLELASLRPVIEPFETIRNACPDKDTPLHQIVQWSKMDLLRDTIVADPFGTDHYAWIDFGIGHVALPPAGDFPARTDLVSVLQMRAVAPSEVADKLDFLRWERGRIAGGFLRGHRNSILRLAGAFSAELAWALSQQFRPVEQGILSLLSATRPELFEFYFGDYTSILLNWDLVRADVATALLNLSHCRATGLFEQGLAVSQRLRVSVKAGAVTMTEDEWSRMLDDEIAAAHHAGRAGTAAAGTEPDGPAVSVVIPVYNGELTLERALRSVLDQTFTDFEVIVVDDASTDASTRLARRLAAEDGRVKVVERTTNSGTPATPRDDGAAASHGRYIALIDQDDEWMPEKLARQVPLFDSDDVAVVYSDAFHENDAGGQRTMAETGITLPAGDILSVMAVHNVACAPTVVFRRDWIERIGRFDRHGLVGLDDYYYWLRISLAGGRFAVVPEPLAVHHWREDGLGNSRPHEGWESWHRMFAAVAAEFPERLGEFPPRRYLPFLAGDDAGGDKGGMRRASVALCMIVRDESAVIERCIGSVRDLISHWVIVDTGSQDDTPDRVRELLAGVPGELYHRPWQDFGANRTELMDLAKGCADYLLLVDADMTVTQTAPLPPLAADAYLVRFTGSLDYAVPRLVRGDRAWRYVGSTHEYLASDDPFTTGTLHGLVVDHHGDGGSRVDKHGRDLRLLERDLAAYPDDERALFYLAQTHRELGHDEVALELYERRAAMGGFAEEAFYAAYQAALLRAAQDPAAGFAALLQAWQRRPTRAEPLYDAACLARNQQWWDLAYLVAGMGCTVARPGDILFVHRWPYDWGLTLERSIAAWWTGRPEECLELSEQLLGRGGEVPPEVAASAESNRTLCLQAGFISPSGDSGRAVPLLGDLVPTIRVGRIDLDVDPPWPSFNPTICADGDGFRVIARTANYELVDGRYHYLDGGDNVQTINYVLRLDGDLAIVDGRPLVDAAERPRFPNEVQGYEDCRLIRWGDRWVATANLRDANPDHWCEVALLFLDPDGGKVVEAHVLPRPNRGRHEKNWMPYVVGDELRLVYSLDPLRLYRWDDDDGLVPLTVAPTGDEPLRWRGGSGGLAVGAGTLFLVHEMVDGRRHYGHRLVLLGDTKVTAVSPLFSFTGQAVEYGAGLALRGGSELVLTFGVNDAMAALATVPYQSALDLLEPVDRSDRD